MAYIDIVPVISDTHINSTVSLCAETMRLDDGQDIIPSAGQKWLRNNFLNFCDNVEYYKKKYKGVVNTVLNGDILEGDIKLRTYQIFTRNKAVIIERAFATLEPLINLSDRLFTVRGTPAHEGNQCELEEEFANNITITERDEKNNTASWWELNAEFGGYYFLIRHHGKIGYRRHTRINPLSTLAVETVFDHKNKRCPDIVICGHNHLWGDTKDNFPVRVISMPCWSLNTEYSYRNAYGKPNIGGMIFVCQDGKIIEEKLCMFDIPEDKIWTEKNHSLKAKGYKNLLNRLKVTR